MQLASEKAMVGLSILRSSVLELELIKDAPGTLSDDEAASIAQLMKTMKAVEMLVLCIGIYADQKATT